MGQSQSRNPAYHPSSVSSQHLAGLDTEHADGARPYPTSASGWIKRPRSRFIGARRPPVSSTNIISYPHHQFIPKEQRQRSAGPIRSRPEPSEYAPRPAPHPPSLLTSTSASPTKTAPEPIPANGPPDTFATQKLPPEASEAKSTKRSSTHRVSATPRDPPLLEESESIKDHASIDGHRIDPLTPRSGSDHGHEPIPISPSLALALKTGLGSGSLRRAQDGQLVVEDQKGLPLTSTAPTQRRDVAQPSSQIEQSADLWTCNPRPQIPVGWHSEWQDLRDRPSDQALPQSGFASSSRAQNSRFSFSSSDPTTTSSSGNQSGAESARRGSSLYATPIDTQRHSYTASESGDSAQQSASISVFRQPIPDASRNWSHARASSSSNESVPPLPTASTPAASMTDDKRHSGTQSSRQRSNPSVFSAAAASSDCDPTLSHNDRIDTAASRSNIVSSTSQTAIDPATVVHRAFDRYEEPAQDTIAPSRRSSMLRFVYSDAAGSGHSSLGTKEVDQLRKGPEVKLHEDSFDTIFESQPARSIRRPRALSLMDRLRGKTARAAEASTAEANMVTVQAQPGTNPTNGGSMRSRLRSLSHAQASNTTTLPTRLRSQSQSQPRPQPPQPQPQLQPQLQPQNRALQRPRPAAPSQLDQQPPQRRSSLVPAYIDEPASATNSGGLTPRAANDISRPTSIRSVRTQRSVRSAKSFTSSNGSLRARYKATQPASSTFSGSRSKSMAASSSSLWWKQNQLKRKGSEGIVSEAQAPKQGRSRTITSGQDHEDSAWLDIEAEAQPTATLKEIPVLAKDGSNDAPPEAKQQKNKEAGGLWIWPRRPSAARVFSFGLSRSQSGHGERAERVESEPCSPTTARSMQHDATVLSPVNVIGMALDTSSNSLKPGLVGSGTGNSSQSSFTSLAPPVPPAPVPPLRKPRRPSQKMPPLGRQDRSDSADSTATVNWMEGSDGRTVDQRPQQQQQLTQSEASLSQMDALTTLAPASSTTAASLAMEAASTAATSVSASTSARALSAFDPKQVIVSQSNRYALSPAPTPSRRLSDISDAGTKEILLSDRESIAAPKMSSESFIPGPIDEQHPDLQTFYPIGSSLTLPARPTMSSITSPLLPMTEEEAGAASPRRVGGVPDFSSPSISLGHDGSLGRSTSLHVQDHSLTEASRSFRSVRSFRSTSDGSVRRYRPLPAIPGRARGNSVDPIMDRRDPSYGADSFVTADAHSRYASREQAPPDRIDGLPLQDTQLSPLMLMGMVTAASSPTQWTHSSHEGYPRDPSRSSVASLTSPIGGPRPLPSIPARIIDATLDQTRPQSKGPTQRRSLAQGGGVGDGPPLSPSAFYETKPQMLLHPAKAPAGPRGSWSSADGPWSAAVVTSSSMVGAVRGMASPERTITDGDVLRRALAQPRDDREDAYRAREQQTTSSGAVIDDDDDAELTRLEKSRSGSKIVSLQKSRSESTDDTGSVNRAPFADTGVQASLAALRALESPGESLRTILARQRIFGEPDASVAEFLRESHILDSETCPDEQDLLAMSGPRTRRRAAPYPRLSDSRYSSEELSSSGRSLSGRRAERARRRRQTNYTGMAEASSASLAETSGRGSDSEGATLAAIRFVRSRTARGSTDSRAFEVAGERRVSTTRANGNVTRDASSASQVKAWEDLAGIGKVRQGSLVAPPSRLDMAEAIAHREGKEPDLPLTLPIGSLEHENQVQRPRHDRYVTATSQPGITSSLDDQDVRDLADQTQDAVSRPPDFDREEGLSPNPNLASPASTMSPALLLKHERVASQAPSSTTLGGSRIAFPSSSMQSGHLVDQRYMQSPSLPQDLASAGHGDPDSYGTPPIAAASKRAENDTDRMTRRMLGQQRQRSRSDVHVSSVRNSKVGLHRSKHHQARMSRYDAQIEDLLLLREKVLQLEGSRNHGRFDSFATSSIQHGGAMSIQDDRSYSIDQSIASARKSSTSSKRKSRPSKLGYTMPDIVAWQAGLGNNNSHAPSAVV